MARVLEVRRGDGTYVTSLQPSVLLERLGGAVEVLQGDAVALQDLMEVRRLLEPMATALAATRISDDQLAEVKRHLDAMREARDDVEQLNAHDAAFHRAVVLATGNGSTVDAVVTAHPLSTRDATLSQAAALLHVSNTEQWLRDTCEPETSCLRDDRGGVRALLPAPRPDTSAVSTGPGSRGRAEGCGGRR